MRQSIPPYLFPPFSLNPQSGQLTRGSDELQLRPKSFAVLMELVRRAGELATKADLLSAVWPRVIVEEAALKNCIREIRSQLGDTARNPTFIQTVHGRGYRFIAPVTVGLTPPADQPDITDPLVGREEPLRSLVQSWELACTGTREFVFVSGEAGIGKTSLVDCFLAQATAGQSVWLGRAQCIEQYGVDEAFLPILEILSALCRGPDGDSVTAILGTYAPTWLTRIPGASLADGDSKRPATQAGPSSTLLAVADAIDALAADRPVVLIIEDLHWSDSSTLELLGMLARRSRSAKLLVLMTYRMESVLRTGHPLPALKQELLLHRKCHEVVMKPLCRKDVAQFLCQKLKPCEDVDGVETLGELIYERTEGHPMFMVEVVRHLVERRQLYESAGFWHLSGDIAEAIQGVPEELLQFIDQQVNRLDQSQQRILEIASLVGKEFSARLIPASEGISRHAVDDCCVELVKKGHMLRYVTELYVDGGVVVQRYAFRHSLHQEALSQRIPPARRIALYREIGRLGEDLHQSNLPAVSTELASIFERGKEYAKACRYLAMCGQRAMQLGAYEDARAHLTKGLELLNLFESPEKLNLELALQVSLAQVYVATLGWAARETGETLAQAERLGNRLGHEAPAFPVLWGLIGHLVLRGQLQEAKALALKALDRNTDAATLIEIHSGLGDAHLWSGEFDAAVESYDHVIALCDGQLPPDVNFGRDPRATAQIARAIALLLQGDEVEADSSFVEATRSAERVGNPYTRACVSNFGAMFCQLKGDAANTRRLAEKTLVLAAKHHFPVWQAMGHILQGWAIAQSQDLGKGIRVMKLGMREWEDSGARWGQSYFPMLLADACRATGDVAEADRLSRLAAAAGSDSGERFYEIVFKK